MSSVFPNDSSTGAAPAAETACEAREFDFVRELLSADVLCALVNSDGIICEASLALRCTVANPVGDTVENVFRMPFDQLCQSTRTVGSAKVVYADPSGELIPAVVRVAAVFSRSGARVLLVEDGATFRETETRRFESTPYTVMRISPDGVVRFANKAAVELFPYTHSEIVDRPLAALLRTGDRAAVEEKLALCVQSGEAQTVKIALSPSGRASDFAVKLIMTPDLAPSGSPLGVLGVIESTAREVVREEIARLMISPAYRDWRERLQKIIQRIHPVIEFEQAIFGIYTPDLKLFRAVEVYPKPSDTAGDQRKKWPARWIDVSPRGAEWLRGEDTWIPNLQDYARDNPAVRDSEVMRHLIDQNVASTVTLLVRAKGGPSSSLTLCSREPDKLGGQALQILRELDLVPVLMRCEESLEEERNEFAERLREIVTRESLLGDAAQSIVDELVKYFDWDYAALFRVDRRQQEFHLFCQAVSKEEYRLPATPPFVQRIQDGMLGQTLRDDKTHRVRDVQHPEADLYNYIAPNQAMRSVMTVPVHLNGRTRWIFDAGSTVSNTFRGPDHQFLKRIVKMLEDGLKIRVLQEMNMHILKHSEQGIVTVGMDGAILDMNDAAAAMLGLKGVKFVAARWYMSEFGANEHAREVLDGAVDMSTRRIELIGKDGEHQTVLASRRDLDRSYDTALWFFTDLKRLAWSRDVRYLQETVSEIARQTRAPLSLASSLALRIPKILASASGATMPFVDKIDDACTRLVAELGKADVTFERLSESASVRKEPVRFKKPVDLAFCMDNIVKRLPARDRTAIERRSMKTSVILGDEGRLAFAIRSALAYLLRGCVDDDVQVVIQVGPTTPNSAGAQFAAISMVLDDKLNRPLPELESAPLMDPVSDATETARDDASLSLEVIRMVIEAHGGLLLIPSPERPGWHSAGRVREFLVELPLLEGGLSS